MEQIIENIYLIKVPLPGNPLKDLNAYFLKGSKRNLLIDTGFNLQPCYDALKHGLDELNVDMNQTDIFLTHFHADHSGLSGRIATTNTKIYLSETDKKYLDLFFKPNYWQARDKEFHAMGFSEDELTENQRRSPLTAYVPSKSNVYSLVKDGMKIDLGDYQLTCFETPGHTPGHMCLIDEARKILFSGDHVIFDITPNITTWEGVDNSLGLYLDSLNKTKALDINTTLSAHRNSVGNCQQRIDQLISHHMDRLAEVYKIVEESPGITAYEIASRMTWSIRAKDWQSFPVVQKWFAVGEAASHLEYLQCNGTIRRELEGASYAYYINEKAK